tara:strand:+ start:492 stop:914 length:423 start_codon:yes stop_codon:yes gene_type:complete
MAHPIDENPDIAVGITLPLRLGNSGYFNQSYTTLEQAKTNIINLILTMKGERVMQPNLGADLHRTLFEQIGNDSIAQIETTIEDAINRWLPYINLDELKISDDTVDVDRNIYRISMKFSLKNDPSRFEEITFKVAGGIGS